MVAKDGVVSVKSFIDIFQEFTSLTHGMEMLPDNWMHIQLPQVRWSHLGDAEIRTASIQYTARHIYPNPIPQSPVTKF